MSKRPPRPWIVLLLGVVERIAAGDGDEVDDPLGPCAGPAVKNLVERPVAGDLALVANRLAVFYPFRV
jgi:hypothetical protein